MNKLYIVPREKPENAFESPDYRKVWDMAVAARDAQIKEVNPEELAEFIYFNCGKRLMTELGIEKAIIKFMEGK